MKYSWLFYILIVCSAAFAQDEAPVVIDSLSLDSTLAEVYKSYPGLLLKQQEIKAYEERLFQQKISFLSSFKLGFQFNDNRQSTVDESTKQVGIAPDFGFSVSIDLETLLGANSRTKQARAELKAKEFEYEQTRREITSELTTRFINFKLALKKYELSMEQFRAIYDNFLIARKKFANGEINIEMYTKAIESKTGALEKLYQSETEVYSAKQKLAEIIGD